MSASADLKDDRTLVRYEDAIKAYIRDYHEYNRTEEVTGDVRVNLLNIQHAGTKYAISRFLSAPYDEAKYKEFTEAEYLILKAALEGTQLFPEIKSLEEAKKYLISLYTHQAESESQGLVNSSVPSDILSLLWALGCPRLKNGDIASDAYFTTCAAFLYGTTITFDGSSLKIKPEMDNRVVPICGERFIGLKCDGKTIAAHIGFAGQHWAATRDFTGICLNPDADTIYLSSKEDQQYSYSYQDSNGNQKTETLQLTAGGSFLNFVATVLPGESVCTTELTKKPSESGAVVASAVKAVPNLSVVVDQINGQDVTVTDSSVDKIDRRTRDEEGGIDTDKNIFSIDLPNRRPDDVRLNLNPATQGVKFSLTDSTKDDVKVITGSDVDEIKKKTNNFFKLTDLFGKGKNHWYSKHEMASLNLAELKKNKQQILFDVWGHKYYVAVFVLYLIRVGKVNGDQMIEM